MNNFNRIEHKRKKASLTIEISLLMPGILAVFILIIFCAYYIHDRCIIEEAMYLSLSKTGSRTSGDKGDITVSRTDGSTGDITGSSSKDSIIEDFLEISEKKLIGKWDFSIDVKPHEDETTIKVNGKMDCMNGIFPDYLSDTFFGVNISESVYTINGPEYMRDSFEHTN